MQVTEDNRNLEEESQFGIPDEVAEDLRAMFRPERPVPGEVDRAILDRVRKHFIRRRPRRLLRWAGSVAAAAVIMLVLVWEIGKEPSFFRAKTATQDVAREEGLEFYASRAKAKKEVASKPMASLTSDVRGVAKVDIDRNGRVDILDAFKLARQLESGGRSEMRWDINGDGVVDRSDVDTVAFVAVRLDKGVL